MFRVNPVKHRKNAMVKIILFFQWKPNKIKIKITSGKTLSKTSQSQNLIIKNSMNLKVKPYKAVDNPTICRRLRLARIHLNKAM